MSDWPRASHFCNRLARRFFGLARIFYSVNLTSPHFSWTCATHTWILIPHYSIYTIIMIKGHANIQLFETVLNEHLSETGHL